MKNTFKSRDAAGLLYPESGGGSAGMVVTAYLSFEGGEPEVTADKTYEEVLGQLMSGGNVVLNAVHPNDPRVFLMSFLGAMYGTVTFVDEEGLRIGVEEDGWYVDMYSMS